MKDRVVFTSGFLIILSLWKSEGLASAGCNDVGNGDLVYIASDRTQQFLSYRNTTVGIFVVKEFQLIFAVPWRVIVVPENRDTAQLGTANGEYCLFSTPRGSLRLSICQGGDKAQQWWHNKLANGSSSQLIVNSETAAYLDAKGVDGEAYANKNDHLPNNAYQHWNFIKTNVQRESVQGEPETIAYLYNPETHGYVNSPATANFPIIWVGAEKHAIRPWHFQRISALPIYQIKIAWNSSLSLCLNSIGDGRVFAIGCQVGNRYQMWHKSSTDCGTDQFLSVQTNRYLSADKDRQDAVTTKSFFELSIGEKLHHWKLIPSTTSDEAKQPVQEITHPVMMTPRPPFNRSGPTDSAAQLTFLGIAEIGLVSLIVCVALAIVVADARSKLRAIKERVQIEQIMTQGQAELDVTKNDAKVARVTLSVPTEAGYYVAHA